MVNLTCRMNQYIESWDQNKENIPRDLDNILILFASEMEHTKKVLQDLKLLLDM